MDKNKVLKILVGVLIVFWILFIAWGMFKTTLKLSFSKATSAVMPGNNNQAPGSPLENNTKQGAKPNIKDDTMLVKVIKLKPIHFQDSLPVLGTVKGQTETELRFEVNGVITDVRVREGDRVKKGDIIAAVDTRDSMLKLEYANKKKQTAESAYAIANNKLQLAESFYKMGGIIKLKLEEAQLEAKKSKLEIEMADQEIKLARNELAKSYLMAPKAGVIGFRAAEVGEFVMPTKKVFTLFDINDVFVEVGIIEKDIDKIKVGQSAEINVDAYPDKRFLGKIDNIFPIIEGKSRTLTAKIKISNPEELLLPGMFARGNIIIVDLNDAFIVPISTIIKMPGDFNIIPVLLNAPFTQAEVEKGSKPGTVSLRRVDIGYMGPDSAEIVSGLEKEDLVIMETQGELKDGIKAKVAGIEDNPGQLQ